ncbi:glycosyltransferase family 4 protein [Psychroserpens mesophilus]|uniref:glycosyltransferase family 4 protein n=1 Tax=Psychroserpens mesophilus TaxID=325473 RepID=UPI00058F8639|nr:glycosyltransferase family 4 protein [Psychroserpens mesophilus]
MNKQHSDTKKIGIVLSSVPGYSETFFRNKIKGLQNNGMEVTLFVDESQTTSHNLPCELIVAPKFNSGFFLKLKNVCIAAIKCCFVNPKQSLKHYKLDKKDGIAFKQRIKNLIFNQYLLGQDLDWLHFGYGMLATNRENVAEATNTKMAVSFRGFDLYLSPLKHQNCYKILFSKNVEFHVLSEKMKQRLTTYHVSENRIHVITPAIDTSLFESPNRKVETRKTLDILCISRLHWVKGLHYLLEAMSILKKDEINFKLTIIGDGEEKERLIFAAHQYGILDDVVFTGKLTQTEVIQHLKTSNVYIQYSIQEGFGNAVLEAQAMGLPCIVSDADGLQQNVLHNKTGWVVPKRNPIALAKKIIDIHFLDPEKRDAITSAAVKRVNNDFNLNNQNRLFLEFYRN